MQIKIANYFLPKNWFQKIISVLDLRWLYIMIFPPFLWRNDSRGTTPLERIEKTRPELTRLVLDAPKLERNAPVTILWTIQILNILKGIEKEVWKTMTQMHFKTVLSVMIIFDKFYIVWPFLSADSWFYFW